MKKILIFMVVLFFVFYHNAYTATIYSSSCSDSDVQSAINSASNGDTVIIRSGQCTWGTGIKIQDKGINLIGSGEDETIITDNSSSTVIKAAIWVYGEEGKPFRISGIGFVGPSHTNGAIKVQGDCKNFRIDHCKFTDVITRGIWVGYGQPTDPSYGVIDHCTFIASTDVTAQGVSITGAGASSWESSLTLGTVNAVYVEDCTFNFSYMNDGALDAYNGARYVFRYNTLINTRIGHHGLANYRSTLSSEIYNNTFNTSVDIFSIFRSRGGTGVLFNNTATGTYTGGLFITDYRSCCDLSETPRPNTHTNCGDWDGCDGSNVVDGNEDATGYPCMDQIGRGPNQVLSPVYEWSNTLNSSDADLSVYDSWGCSDPSMADHIKENRDFYNDTERPDYTPYTYPHPLTVEDPLLSISNINGGGLSISNIGSGGLTISNVE